MKGLNMRKAIMTIALSLVGLVAILAGVWFTNLFGLKEGIYVSQIVKMRVAPERLTNPKTPQDYGMAYTDVEFTTADNVRLSAWEIPAAAASDRTLIVNHPLGTTRYGSLEGLDGVAVEFLPMIKHLHDAGYNVVMYDHRGQGGSDGGTGKTLMGTEAPVGVGETEWQDVVASLRYVKAHATFGDDQIGFVSQCMGANATFLAWQNEPELFSDTMITSLVAIQPPISYNMNDRFIMAKTGLDLVDKVLDAQREKYGFGYADIMTTVKSLTVPVLYTQVRKDEYTFDVLTGRNDIEDVVEVTPTENQLIWIGPNEANPHGTGKRFDGYGYFNEHPEELLSFLNGKFS
ncbi:MAG: hypothetical protein ACI84R_000883 [Candidatus Azotimanducaceae bacterium]|jgi:hypothetical protein